MSRRNAYPFQIFFHLYNGSFLQQHVKQFLHHYAGRGHLHEIESTDQLRYVILLQDVYRKMERGAVRLQSPRGLASRQAFHRRHS